MKKSVLLLILLLGFQCITTSAQQSRVLAMSVDASSPIEDTTQFGVPVIDSTTVFTVAMNIILADTDSIYQVHVKLGSSLHGTEYLSSSFDYGVDGIFGSTNYSQTGNVIILGLGTQQGMVTYYAEVQIEKTDHSYEEAVLFSNN